MAARERSSVKRSQHPTARKRSRVKRPDHSLLLPNVETPKSTKSVFNTNPSLSATLLTVSAVTERESVTKC